jgi:signal transduction histidine kinase
MPPSLSISTLGAVLGKARLRMGGLVSDLGLAALATASIVLITSVIEPSGDDRPLDALGYAVMILAGAALVGRRARPVGVTAVVTASLAVYLGRGHPGGPVFVCLFVAVYSVAVGRDRRTSLVVAGVAAGALVLVGELAGTGPGLVHLVFVGWTAAAVFLGDAVRSHRFQLAALRDRAAHLEASRDDEARRRVAEERLRIAQDLHDSVAHSMAIINVQAALASRVFDRHPSRSREALDVIRRASGEVLDELAAFLRLMPVGDEAASRAPTPGPTALPALVEFVRQAGLELDLCMDGSVDDVSQPIGVAPYRVVQESLTNVVRHAGPGTRARVAITRDGGGKLTLEVTDDGRGANGAPRAGAGVGLVGMRERTVATGGAFTAGPRREGGFLVRAVCPVGR